MRDNLRMRRADRLFQIVQLIRRQGVVTAEQLARRLEVSERTIYRDVADLIGAGVPIRGEAGVGYGLESGYDLPPMMFSVEEIEALVLGARMVSSWCGDELADAAKDVLAKVEHALPARLRRRMNSTALFVPDLGWTLPGSEQLADVRVALRDQRKLRIRYRDAVERRSERLIRPLGIFFWGAVATLGAWCELREDFRNFRLDRIESLELSPDLFQSEPGRSLHDYYQAMAERSQDEADV